MSKKILHTAESRGTTNLGWLHSRHTFSFGDYHQPDRLNFGALRVLNDDMVAPGKGFGTHPHSNMEIITIPLEGELRHNDDLNNTSVIGEGEIQVMSAGTGVFHSEINHNKSKTVRFLQIWIMPKTQKIKPRYEQLSYEIKENDLNEILSPDLDDDRVSIHQDAWIYMGNILNTEHTLDYFLKSPEKNGVYIFVLNGELEANDQILKTRDGMGIWDVTEIHFKANQACNFLLIEVPMKMQ
jgi:redox-sensitive bicupin YhaK (pirin superfamily)